MKNTYFNFTRIFEWLIAPMMLHVNWQGGLGGAAQGAQMGASLGSIVPGFGTAIGGIVGGVGGAISGLFGKKKKAPAPPPFISGRYTDELVGGANQIETRERNLARDRFAATDPERMALYQQAPTRTSDLLEQSKMYDPMAQQLGQGYFDALQGYEGFSPVGSHNQGTSGLLAGQFQRAGDDAALGGKLSDVQRAEIARSSLTGAGATGITGRTMGDITARDLGLSSVAMDQQRQNRAAQLGGVQQGIMDNERSYMTQLDQWNAQQQMQDQNNRIGLLGQGLGTMEGLRGGYADMANQQAAMVNPYATQVYSGRDDLKNWSDEQQRLQNYHNAMAGVAQKDYQSSVAAKNQGTSDMMQAAGILGGVGGGIFDQMKTYSGSTNVLPGAASQTSAFQGLMGSPVTSANLGSSGSSNLSMPSISSF